MAAPVWLVMLVQYLHVFCAIWWFGSILTSRIITRPALRKLDPEIQRVVSAATLNTSSRRWFVVYAGGTIIFGILRGLLNGVFDQLDSAYGRTYLAALVIGVLMLAWAFVPTPRAWQPIGSKVFVAAFPVMLGLMVLMRFGL